MSLPPVVALSLWVRWSLIAGATIDSLGWGMLGIAAAALINAFLGGWLIRVGRRTGSNILVADGMHVAADAWTSGGVIVGVLLAWVTGLTWIDGATAMLVGVMFLIEGIKLLREAWAGLMDEVDPALVDQAVETLNANREPEWYDVHQLRCHRVGDLVHIDLHLVVPGTWSVARGHVVMELIEQVVLDDLTLKGTVLVHLDPLDTTLETPIEERHPAVTGAWTTAMATRMAVDLSPQKSH